MPIGSKNLGISWERGVLAVFTADGNAAVEGDGT
jgi:hypothetical protein